GASGFVNARSLVASGQEQLRFIKAHNNMLIGYNQRDTCHAFGSLEFRQVEEPGSYRGVRAVVAAENANSRERYGSREVHSDDSPSGDSARCTVVRRRPAGTMSCLQRSAA